MAYFHNNVTLTYLSVILHSVNCVHSTESFMFSAEEDKGVGEMNHRIT